MGTDSSFSIVTDGGDGEIALELTQTFTRGPLHVDAPTDSYLSNFVLALSIENQGAGTFAVSMDAPMPGVYGLWASAADTSGTTARSYFEVDVAPTIEGVLSPPHALVGLWFESHPQPDEWRLIEDVLGHDLTIVGVEFTSFCTRGCNEYEHLHRFYDWIVDAAKVPLVSFDYFNWDWDAARAADYQPTLDDVVAGEWDDYLTTLATNLATFDGPILFAPGWEPNITSNDDTWRGPRAFGPGANLHWYETGDLSSEFGDPEVPDGPERYVAAWQHIRGIFHDSGAENVMFVWRPNWVSAPKEPWNTLEAYWPGDGYVDLIGPSVYNYENENRDLDDLWQEELADLTAHHDSVPVLMGEVGSSSIGNDPLWHADALRRFASYPNGVGITFFSEDMGGLYAFHEDTAKTDAIRAVLAEGYYGLSE